MGEAKKLNLRLNSKVIVRHESDSVELHSLSVKVSTIGGYIRGNSRVKRRNKGLPTW